MISLLIKLFLSHFLGDFLLQSTKWVKHKKLNKYKSVYLYLHVGIHILVMLLLLQFSTHYIFGILFIGVSHLIIDWVKLQFGQTINDRTSFFIDQFIHLSVILLVVYYYYPKQIDFSFLISTEILLFEMFLLLTTVVSSIIMKVIISKWNIDNNLENSLNQAGRYIGILERLFIFMFIITHHWEGIGFLLAAKSVFRFGDLSNSKDRKLTEYILIGTLISFGLAILSGIGYEKLLNLI